MANETLPELADDAGGDLTPDLSAGADTNENFFMRIWNDSQKRLYVIIGGSVLLVLLLGFAFLGPRDNENRGKLVPLVQELDQARAFEIVAKLKEVNIESKVLASEVPGEYIVEVYENAVETSYLNLSRTNLLQDEGYGLFDENDWAASDYDKRIKLIRAINGDLSRIISRMEGLRAAIVRVNIPEQQLFTEFQSPTTATVQVELDNEGEELGRSQVKSIVNILRGYVPDLEKDHISVVDTTGRNYSTFKEEFESGSDDYIEELEKVNKSIKKRIEKYLDDVIGSDKYRVSVSASISRERVQKQQTKFTEGVIGTRQSAKEALNSGAGGQAPGAAGPAAPKGKNYVHDTTNESMYPSYEQESVTYLPGRITNVSVALAVDKSVPATMSLKQLQESIAAIAGPGVSAESVKLNVVDLISSDAQSQVLNKDANADKGFWSFLGFNKSKSVSEAASTPAKPTPWYMKLLYVVGIIIGIVILGIIGLAFLGAAVARQQAQTSVDPNLGESFDDYMNDDFAMPDDYGEAVSLAQQEELLNEMMGAPPVQDFQEGPIPQAAAPQPSMAETPQANKELNFESLLGNFQSTAEEKPEALAKKIQVWLEDDNG